MENQPRNVTQEKEYLATIGAAGIVKRKLFYFAAACPAKSLVVCDYATTTYGIGQAAAQSGATADLPTVLGITEVAVVAATWGEVVVYGPADCLGAADLDAGDPVCSAATAGTVREYVEGTDGNRVGFALEADGAVTAGYARIFVQLG